jgi:hypothetical protein
MGKMEWSLLDLRKREHEEIVTTIRDLERIGYIVSGISHKNGYLEIICYPPNNEDDTEKKFREAVEAGYGVDASSPGLSMDGVSETFKA